MGIILKYKKKEMIINLLNLPKKESELLRSVLGEDFASVESAIGNYDFKAALAGLKNASGSRGIGP